MAIYHLTVSHGSRAGGQSALAKMNYIARIGRYDDREDLGHLESGNMPTWARDAKTFWAGADAHSRANGRLYTEVEAALPHELSEEQAISLVRDFAKRVSQVRGGHVPYTFGIHAKPGNRHAHLELASRSDDKLDRADAAAWFKQAYKKDPLRGGAQSWAEDTNKVWLEQLRATWAEMANEALANASSTERIDHRSHARRGMATAPTHHCGWASRRRREVLEYNERVMEANAAMIEAGRVAHNLRKQRAMELEEERRVKELKDRQRQAQLDQEAEAMILTLAAQLRASGRTLAPGHAPDLQPHFMAKQGRYGVLYIRMPADALAMLDTGDCIKLKEDDEDTARAALQLAAARWEVIEIECDEDQRDAWIDEAAKLGLEGRIRFADPPPGGHNTHRFRR